MHTIEYGAGIKKDFKKLDRPVLLFLKQSIISAIAHDPFRGELLRGNLRKYRRYAFSYGGVAYRIAYEIKQDRTVVLLILVSTRENFYKELKRRVR